MKILYEDKQILVCAKEAGLPVQSGDVLKKDLVSILKNHLSRDSSAGREPYLAVIHRLDQPVQGILVFAKTKTAAADLSRQVTDGRMEKRYLAKVKRTGGTAQEHENGGEQVLVDYLIRERAGNASRIANPDEPGAKRAELLFEPEGEDLLRIRLKTGRHHQIRVQLAHAGFPILGDRKYGHDASFPWPALCACSLSFDHPVTKKRLRFELEREEIWFGADGV